MGDTDSIEDNKGNIELAIMFIEAMGGEIRVPNELRANRVLPKGQHRVMETCVGQEETVYRVFLVEEVTH